MPRPQSQKLDVSRSSQKTSILSTPQKPPTPPAKPDGYDIIIYEYIEVQPGEDVDTIAKETLRRAMESAGRGAAGERMAYGNQAGQSLLEMIVTTQVQIKELNDRMANKDTQIKGLEDWMANKDTQIKGLEDWMANKDI